MKLTRIKCVMVQILDQSFSCFNNLLNLILIQWLMRNTFAVLFRASDIEVYGYITKGDQSKKEIFASYIMDFS